MRITKDSLEKTLMLGKIEGRRRREDRGWDGWMASQTWWTWVWVNSGSWWWTGRPGVLRFMGSQRVGHDWATELNWYCWSIKRFTGSKAGWITRGQIMKGLVLRKVFWVYTPCQSSSTWRAYGIDIEKWEDNDNVLHLFFLVLNLPYNLLFCCLVAKSCLIVCTFMDCQAPLSSTFYHSLLRVHWINDAI